MFLREAGFLKRALLLILVVFTLGGISAGLYLVFWRSSTGEGDDQRLLSDWKKLSKLSLALSDALTARDPRTSATEAEYLYGKVSKISKRQAELKYGRDTTRAKSIAALKAVMSYLKALERALRAPQEQARDAAIRLVFETGTIARAKVWEIESSLGQTFYFGSGFFEGAILISNRGENNKMAALKERIRQTVFTFMNAHIREYNPDVLWSLLSRKIIEVLKLFGVTRENFSSMWKKETGSSSPVDFTVSAEQIAIEEFGRAKVKVVCHLSNGSSRVDSVGLILENGVWKIDSYPLAGIYGTAEYPSMK